MLAPSVHRARLEHTRFKFFYFIDVSPDLPALSYQAFGAAAAFCPTYRAVGRVTGTEAVVLLTRTSKGCKSWQGSSPRFSQFCYVWHSILNLLFFLSAPSFVLRDSLQMHWLWLALLGISNCDFGSWLACCFCSQFIIQRFRLKHVLRSFGTSALAQGHLSISAAHHVSRVFHWLSRKLWFEGSSQVIFTRNLRCVCEKNGIYLIDIKILQHTGDVG